MSGLNDVNDVPKAWRSALAAMRLAFPDAVIAGGALRDREHGVKVKDIDIFISTNETATAPIERRLREHGWPDVRMNGDASYGADAKDRKIVGVFDLPYPGCPDIQLIAMRQFHLEEIDFGICQIMFDGKTIVRTRDYHLDMAAKQFRLIPKVDDGMFVRSLGRWARLKEKYPEWKLHLGSRAETDPFVPPKRELVFDHIDMPGVTSFQQADRLRRYHSGGMIDLGSPPTAPLDYLLRTRASEFVIPKALAERMSRELPRSVVKPHRNVANKFEVDVHPDEVTRAARMIQDTVDRMQDQHRFAAIGGMTTLGHP